MGSANGSANGWNFQITAAIILFFNDVKNIKSIKIEGKKQDIEIEYNSGKKALCQVKCKSEETISITEGKHLRDALSSLLKFKNEKDTDFYYVSNIQNPICVSTSKKEYIYDAIFNYNQLPLKDQKKIKDIMGDDFPLERIKVAIFFYNGDLNAKTKFARSKIEDFCNMAGVDTSFVGGFLNTYINLFFDDACKARRVNETKERFIWPIIVTVLTDRKYYNDLLTICDDDEEILNIILSKYKTFINEKIGNYEFITDFFTDYEIEKHKYVKNPVYSFVNDCYMNYLDKFSIEPNEEIRAYLAKVVIYRVLNSRRTIIGIKEASGIK